MTALCGDTGLECHAILTCHCLLTPAPPAAAASMAAGLPLSPRLVAEGGLAPAFGLFAVGDGARGALPPPPPAVGSGLVGRSDAPAPPSTSNTCKTVQETSNKRVFN